MQYQRLRLAIGMHKKREDLRHTLNHINIILKDKNLKYSNTIFVIGEELFRDIDEKASIYKINFSNVLKNHYEVKDTIYWSAPIGWETLKLYLKESAFSKAANRKQRYYRYQVPGQIKTEFEIKKLNLITMGVVYDISQRGLRLRIQDKDYEKIEKIIPKATMPKDKNSEISKPPIITINNFRCKCKFIPEMHGKILHGIEHGSKTKYIGIEFDDIIDSEKLAEFLHNCNIECYPI